MPIYELICKNCNHVFTTDIISYEKMKEFLKPNVVCDNCHEGPLEQKIGPVPFTGDDDFYDPKGRK